MSLLERFPHFRGWYVQASMELGPEDVSLLERCPYSMYRFRPEDIGVLKSLQVLRLDITPMAPPTSHTHSLSSARLITFSPTAMDHLLVVTSSGENSSSGLLKFSASNGQLLSEVHNLCSDSQLVGMSFPLLSTPLGVPYSPWRVYSTLPGSWWPIYHHSWGQLH